MLYHRTLNPNLAIASVALLLSSGTGAALAAAGGVVPKGKTYVIVNNGGQPVKTLPGGAPLPMVSLVQIKCPKAIVKSVQSQGKGTPNCWRAA